LQVHNGILHLCGDKHLNYVAVDKISFAREVGDDERQAGFVAGPGES
jgi:hypothetical protein